MLAFVNFDDKLILTRWNWIVQIVGMKNPEESKPDYAKNWRCEEKTLRDTRIRTMHGMEELKRAQEMRVDEFSVQKLRESSATIQQLTSQMQELQERVNYMNDSRESNYSGKLSHVPSHPAVVPSPRSMLTRDQSMPPDTWNLSGTQGNMLGNPRAMFVSSQISYQGILHATNQSATGGVRVQRSTGRLVAKGEELTGSTIPIPIFAKESHQQ